MKQYQIYIKDFLKCIIIAVVLSLFLTNFIVEARQVPTGSMQPTIEIGDKIIVDKIFYQMGQLERGDIVVFRPPLKDIGDMEYIKRVMGLPGDTIEVKAQQVYINGIPLEEDYIAEAPSYDYGPLVIPEETIFVMGDNRNNSLDSHSWGVVPQENVKGKAFLRFWPFKRIGPVK